METLNSIMKQDPSFRQGTYGKVFERKCPVEMKIIEQSIINMVGQDVTDTEHLHFKLMVKQADTGSDKKSELSDLNPDIIRLELMSDNDYFFQYVYE